MSFGGFGLNQSQGGMYIEVAMMISWGGGIALIRTWTMNRLRSLTPTICASHLGFGLGHGLAAEDVGDDIGRVGKFGQPSSPRKLRAGCDQLAGAV